MDGERETLADLLIRETFKNEKKSFLSDVMKRSPNDIRRAIFSARRFVLDEKMSAFMADLSSVPFVASEARRDSVLDSLRHGAMVPFPVTWIEYDALAFRRRLLDVAADKKDVFGKSLVDESHVPPRIGWLLEQHPQLPHVARMTEFLELDNERVGGIPFSVVWNCTDDPLPWKADHRAGELAHGITGYHCEQIGVVLDHGIPDYGNKFRLQVQHEGDDPSRSYATHSIVAEMGGMARYAMAFLATLNDVPATMVDVRPSKGYVAKGSYRKFVDHKVIRLSVPQRTDMRRLAKKMIALSRRRWHEVRPHWRLHHKGSVLCHPGTHEWGPMQDSGRAHCMKCEAWRTWIVLPKGRGDALLGVVTHEYAVTHHGARNAGDTVDRNSQRPDRDSSRSIVIEEG